MEINKLVRNHIPNIIARSGQHVTYHALSDEELKVELRRKTIEEATELANATDKSEIIEELADLETLIYEIKKVYDISRCDIDIVHRQKLCERGGFDEGYWLEKVEDNNDSN